MQQIINIGFLNYKNNINSKLIFSHKLRMILTMNFFQYEKMKTKLIGILCLIMVISLAISFIGVIVGINLEIDILIICGFIGLFFGIYLGIISFLFSHFIFYIYEKIKKD